MAADDLYLSASDLGGFYQSTQQTDPYGIAGRSLQSWQPNTSTFTTAESGITAFAKAFLGGLLQNYGQRRASEQLMNVANVLPQLQADPYNTAAPEGVDASAFQLLRGTSIIKNAQRKQASEAQGQSNLVDLIKAVAPSAITSGEMTAPAALEAMRTGKFPETLAGADPLQNPKSRQYQVALDIKTEEDARRKEINMIPSVAQFASMQKSLPLVRGFKDQNTKSSDVGFVYNFIKALDDGAVRGEEIDMAAASNPLVQQYAREFQSALDGTSTLTPTLKNRMYQELVGAQKGVFEQAKNDAKVIEAIAKQRGITGNILPFDPSLTFDVAPGPTLDRAAIEQRKAEVRALNPTISAAALAGILRSEFGG